MEQQRYKPTNTNYLAYFLVECPKCKNGATVNYTGYYYSPQDIHIKCPSCMYSAKLEPMYQVTVKRNCPNCGKQFSWQMDNLSEAPKEVSIPCQHCDFRAEYTPTVTAYYNKGTDDKLKKDPFFAYPLRLQTEVKGNLFWAYNREHLHEIEIFVKSDLRERESPYLMTMVARLPHFIQDAKNRELILRKIKQLQNTK